MSELIDADLMSANALARKIADNATYADLNAHYDCWKDDQILLEQAIDSIGNKRSSLTQLFLDTELLIKLRDNPVISWMFWGLAGDLDGVSQDAFDNYFALAGERIVQGYARDLKDAWLHWMWAALGHKARHLHNNGTDLAKVGLIILGAAFPITCLRSKAMVEAARRHGLVERAKEIAATAPYSHQEKGKPPQRDAVAEIEEFARLAARADTFDDMLPMMLAHPAMQAALDIEGVPSIPVHAACPPETCSVVLFATESPEAQNAAFCRQIDHIASLNT